MAYFKTCPRCGAHLDPQEECDCQKEGMKNAPGMAVPVGHKEKHLYGYYNRESEDLQWQQLKFV